MSEAAQDSVIGPYPKISRPVSTLDVVFLIMQYVLAAALMIAGMTKLGGAHMYVETFEKVGVGQWFRYFTGSVELITAVLLIMPRTSAVGAALAGATMAAAVATHILVIGGSVVPALVLFVLATAVAWYRCLYV